MRDRWPFFICAASVLLLGAGPYVPVDDNEVLETLPRELLSGRDELRDLRRALAAEPGDAALATAVAQRYVQLGKRSGDPRYYGHARAALRPWWDLARADEVPAAVLRLRAKLKEMDHDYDGALADLRQLLERKPGEVQAWIEVSNLHRVKGEYAEAWAACDALNTSGGGALPVLVCRVPLQAVTGAASAASDTLSQALPVAREHNPELVPWMLTQRAEVARALGRQRAAEDAFREGLAADPGDLYLRRAYADFLLDGGREAEALSLTREHTADTGVLLRAAIAARRSGQEAQARTWRAELDNRFEEIRLRGGRPHGRYEARAALELQDDPQRALALALENWGQQKELRDSRNVLEAAQAAGDPAAAQPVLAFLAESGTEDVALAALAQQLGERE